MLGSEAIAPAEQKPAEVQAADLFYAPSHLFRSSPWLDTQEFHRASRFERDTCIAPFEAQNSRHSTLTELRKFR